MLEPENNPNRALIVDPPRPVRFLMSKKMTKMADGARIAEQRGAFEANRAEKKQAHVVEYFHQFDDPYSHLTAQILAEFASRYHVEIKPHLMHATGGKDQPEALKLAIWARRDAALIAPYFNLEFPENAPKVPNASLVKQAQSLLIKMPADKFVAKLKGLSTQVWQGDKIDMSNNCATDQEVTVAVDRGSDRIKELKYYSGASFYYGGEWYWGVDRLFHLEQRLKDLSLAKSNHATFIAPRPEIDVQSLNAKGLTLDFFPSLNSPYTAIIFDKTIAMAKASGVMLNHKPVLPMIMRGVAATQSKADYIFFDTKREADFFNVPFGPVALPIGTPTRQSYSLLPWAKMQGKDIQLLSVLLRFAFAEGVGLHKKKNIRRAVEEVGLDWLDARKHLGSDDWKAITEKNQDEMVEGMGLWGVPSYRLSGPDPEPDLEVWGQDRLWLVAAEMHRRCSGTFNNEPHRVKK
ncbi:MAG: 2-hydroxychromene-2-carboxylate isomerase [Pseudohongiellaceae bacterium]|jgi:2-hydroxychromene-2-carboxylate isomerase